jgi:hypothetical protein
VTRSSSAKQQQLSLMTCTSLPHLDPVEQIATAGKRKLLSQAIGQKQHHNGWTNGIDRFAYLSILESSS